MSWFILLRYDTILNVDKAWQRFVVIGENCGAVMAEARGITFWSNCDPLTFLNFLLQPEKVEFHLKLGQSRPIRESPD
ncbi:hypothetical protein L1887_27763 [Cichorium endivia]|nr:hypothetical protein L1887_27763 [Cichorium endivia]